MENFNKKLNLNLDADFLVHTIPPRILHDPVGDLQGAQTAAHQTRCFMVLKKTTKIIKNIIKLNCLT